MEKTFRTQSPTTPTRQIEAPAGHITLHLDLITLVNQLPATELYIPSAVLIRYVRIWTETLEGMVAKAEDWAILGSTFSKQWLTCFTNGEAKVKEVEYRQWYLEEGRVDELVAYMTQHLLNHKEQRMNRIQRRAQPNASQLQDALELRTNTEVTFKARKEAIGKAIKVMTSNSTQLNDDQKRSHVPIFLPSGNVSHRRITGQEITQAAAHLPAGATAKDVKS